MFFLLADHNPRRVGERREARHWLINLVHSVLYSFVFDFPAEHWIHLRTTNPVESPFATVKARTKVTKGAGSRQAGLAMAFKLLLAAELC
jgi:transposase-like protein